MKYAPQLNPIKVKSRHSIYVEICFGQVTKLIIIWSVSASSGTDRPLNHTSRRWSWGMHLYCGWMWLYICEAGRLGKGKRDIGFLLGNLLAFHFCLIFYLKYVRKTARSNHPYSGWEWVYVWGWWWVGEKGEVGRGEGEGTSIQGGRPLPWLSRERGSGQKRGEGAENSIWWLSICDSIPCLYLSQSSLHAGLKSFLWPLSFKYW